MAPAPPTEDTHCDRRQVRRAGADCGDHRGRRLRGGGDTLFSVRLLLVDENDDFLDGLSAWLAESPSFQVVDVAHSANEAIDRIGRLAPHLVLPPCKAGFRKARGAGRTHRVDGAVLAAAFKNERRRTS